jgi:hypothetical protein
VAEDAQPDGAEGQGQQDPRQQRERELHPGDHGGEAADLLKHQAECRRRRRARRRQQRQQDQQQDKSRRVRVEARRRRDRDHDDARHREHHDVAQDGAEQQRQPARRGDPQPLDHARVELPDDRPAGAHPRAEGDQHQDTRNEHVEHVPRREARPAGQRVQQRREQRQVQQRSRQPHDDPGGLPH